MSTKTTALQILSLRAFIGARQLSAIGSAMRGEEKQFFIDKMASIASLVSTMPKTYEQDGLGDQAIAFLHYFKGGMDWYITEKDMETTPDDPGQYEAFGLANLGYGGELGYISIVELIAAGVELDMYFKPTTLAKIRETS